MRGKNWLGLLLAGALLTAAGQALAQADRPQMLRVTVDKAEVVNLDAASTIVLIVNPEIADVIVERNRLLFVLGKHPGETSLYVYNDTGQRILERNVVVVPQDSQMVTVTRQTTPSEYYCLPRCVLKTPGGNAPSGGGGGAPTPAGAAPAAAAAAAAPLLGIAPALALPPPPPGAPTQP
jgi:hypothetical protein